MKMNQADRLKSAYRRGLSIGRAFGIDGLNGQYFDDFARAIAVALGCPKKEIIARVVDFHRERVDAVPSLRKYPELKGWRERILEEERGIRDAGVDLTDYMLFKTLRFWQKTRLYEETGRVVSVSPSSEEERCRVLYVPESDVGALHAKNVDRLLSYWKPRPAFPRKAKWPFQHPLVFDGVGSGLLIDETSPEIFPVDVRELCKEHCTTVKEATEFMTRYNYFWRGQNLLIHDHRGNSIALDKTACRIAVRKPNAQGISFVNGMGSLDPDLNAFIRRQRQKFLDLMKWTWEDSPDGCFYRVCENKWRNMQKYVGELSLRPTFDNVKQLMEQRDKDGPMCLTGGVCHPKQKEGGYTVVMDIYMMDRKQLHRRQWKGKIPAFLDHPERVRFV